MATLQNFFMRIFLNHISSSPKLLFHIWHLYFLPIFPKLSKVTNFPAENQSLFFGLKIKFKCLTLRDPTSKSLNYRPLDKPSLLFCFVNKVVLEHRCVHLFMYLLGLLSRYIGRVE